MDSEAGLTAAVAALPARFEALRSGDEAAILGTLQEMAALAPPVHDAAQSWRWCQFAAGTCVAMQLLAVLAPLLEDERYTDAVLALCVPLLASLQRHKRDVDEDDADSLFVELGVEAGPEFFTVLIDPLITLLARAAADEGASGDALQRVQRRVHAVLECLYAVHMLTEEEVLSLHERFDQLEEALVALLRRTPCSSMDVNAYRAANMLSLCDG